MRVAKIKTNLRRFFHHWITVTEPLHNLGKTEKAVLAELLYYRYLLSQEVSSEDLLNKLLFDYEVKVKICEAVGIPKTRMPLILTKLRKEGMVIGRSLNKSYIPKIEIGDKSFILAYKFLIDGNEEGVYKKKGDKKDAKDSSKT